MRPWDWEDETEAQVRRIVEMNEDVERGIRTVDELRALIEQIDRERRGIR